MLALMGGGITRWDHGLKERGNVCEWVARSARGMDLYRTVNRTSQIPEFICEIEHETDIFGYIYTFYYASGKFLKICAICSFDYPFITNCSK